ncbi:MAG: hypothetical protein Q9216_000149 [Gyalolechia sp. 2 TL-2023]
MSKVKTPRLQSLGESQVLIPAQLGNVDENSGQNAVQRDQNIKQIVQAYPELAPCSGLLSSLAETSETIQQTTAGYDPSISELLAFGQALHPRHHRADPSTVPVIAVPGGLAGQLVKVVQLVPEVVGWDGERKIKLKNESFQSRVQGLWSGNGSRIQQLHFANLDCEPTEWLAVRYSGATSIIRPVLREKEMSQLHDLFHLPMVEEVELRIELEHIVTLTTRRSGGMAHADVCFNPCNPSEFAILDRSCRWSVWRIQSIDGKTGLWTLAPGPSGQLEEPLPDGVQDPASGEPRYDGWGAVRWVSNGTGLVICDIEDDSMALEDLLSIIEGRSDVGHEGFAGLREESISTFRLDAGILKLGDSLSRTYDALILPWVSSLAARIPGRVRTRTERLVRCIAAELQLASCGLRLRLKEGDQLGEESQNIAIGGRTTFTLAVRSTLDFSNDPRRPKGKAVGQASGEAEASPISEHRYHMPPVNLPTPEPTPSVNSQASSSTLGGTEDLASVRLRSLASLASQPPLPAAMMGILSHWPVGQSPDDYNWETSKVVFEHDDKPEEGEERARVKKRQRRHRLPTEQSENAVVPPSQLLIPRLAASQVERPSDLQYSSQPTLATGSQPQPGRFGGRKPVKRDKKPGFR